MPALQLCNEDSYLYPPRYGSPLDLAFKAETKRGVIARNKSNLEKECDINSLIGLKEQSMQQQISRLHFWADVDTEHWIVWQRGTGTARLIFLRPVGCR